MRNTTNMIITAGTLCLATIMCAAIAYQEFSWWVFPFAILFGAIFLGILSICFLEYRADRYKGSVVDDYPDQPWMWDARWRSGKIKSRSNAEFWGTLTFTVVLAMFALIGVASLVQGLLEGNLWVLLNVFPIVFALYFSRSTCRAWRVLRHERLVSVVLETRPAWVGSRFCARMKTTGGPQPEQFMARLEHFTITRQEDGGGVSFSKVVDQTLSGRIEDMEHGSARIFVDIPEHSPETAWTGDEPGGWWDLVLSMHVSGVEVPLRYEVPVANPEKYQQAS